MSKHYQPPTQQLSEAKRELKQLLEKHRATPDEEIMHQHYAAGNPYLYCVKDSNAFKEEFAGKKKKLYYYTASNGTLRYMFHYKDVIFFEGQLIGGLWYFPTLEKNYNLQQLY